MDAAIYARLSKRRSRRRTKEKVEGQVTEAQIYAERNLMTIVLIESDNDISASKYSTKPRPGYERLIRAIQSGQVEVILVTEMSRLYRRMEELLTLIELSETT